MLVLSRKVGESIVIEHPTKGAIIVYVSRIVGHRITLSLDAPSDVRIVRGELDRFEPKAAEVAP